MEIEKGLLEASKLFKEMGQKSVDDNFDFGYAVIRGTATEFKTATTPDKVRLQGKYAKTHGQVFTEFLTEVQNGNIAVVGDRGILDSIGSKDEAFLGCAVDYQGKDLPVVIVNRHVKTLTELPNELINVSGAIEAISDAVFTLNGSRNHGRSIKISEIPSEHFETNGVTIPFN